jgi:hypothetical protein
MTNLVFWDQNTNGLEIFTSDEKAVTVQEITVYGLLKSMPLTMLIL